MQQLLSAHLEPDSGNAFSHTLRHAATTAAPHDDENLPKSSSVGGILETHRHGVTHVAAGPQNFVLRNSDSLRKEGP